MTREATVRSTTKVTAENPIAVRFTRKGGCVLTGRMDFWQEDALVACMFFQRVTQNTEMQEIRLPTGNYTAVFSFRAEESLHGHFTAGLFLQQFQGDQLIDVALMHKSSDVNTSPTPHESEVFIEEFELSVH